MSVDKTETIDAANVRDGWVVLSIYHFEAWEPLDERLEELRLKLDTYETFVGEPRFQMHFHRTPARIELISRDNPPDQVRQLCAARGIFLRCGPRQ